MRGRERPRGGSVAVPELVLMDQSSSFGHVAGTAASWLFAVVCVVSSIVYFDELRAVGRWALGVPAVDAENAMADGRAATAEDPANAKARDGHVELAADRRGHFVTDAQVNGRTVEVMVDTGATTVAMSWEDAENAGIYVRPSDFTQTAYTANGAARFAPVVIESIAIGNITVRNVRGAVAERGKLNGTLLGMTFLGRLTRAELSRGKLILEE